MLSETRFLCLLGHTFAQVVKGLRIAGIEQIYADDRRWLAVLWEAGSRAQLLAELKYSFRSSIHYRINARGGNPTELRKHVISITKGVFAWF